MHATSPLTSTVLFHIGPVAITRPVVTTWVIMLALDRRLLARNRGTCKSSPAAPSRA